ncbi:glycosyltransferase family 2 protein [Mesobacterium pallidum]|uniref:glycosyltransferase family 2 protein n=1 Tax=Mesobacterium pallidum TaxID=2872037 RepID=UPI001EE20150|nr:glycosyltransferase family 2 protein [Mesobacterium pallidum]
MKMSTISVAFVLPCLNEAETIEWCVLRAKEAIGLIEERFGLTGEVIVADNGSTDGSQALAEAAGARVVPIATRGYGAALMGGFRAAKADYLVMGDSDCSYDFVEALPMVEKLLQGADVCMGNRFKGGIKPGAMPWKNRYIGNPALSGILRLLYRTDIGDAHCGIRALSRDAFERMKLSSTGMEFASEMVLKSVLMRLNVAEVPVTLSPDGRGRPPHLNPWRDGLRHLIYMFLLSPTWLFLAPAAALALFGVTVMAALLSAGGSELVSFAGLRLGTHWAVVASGAVVLSVQLALMGIYATLYGYREGYRRPEGLMARLLGRSRLQYWLGAGLMTMGAGFAWAFAITAGWVASDFGQLNAMRGLIGASTTTLVGAELFFAGFMLSIISGNRSRHAAVAAV